MKKCFKLNLFWLAITLPYFVPIIYVGTFEFALWWAMMYVVLWAISTPLQIYVYYRITK